MFGRAFGPSFVIFGRLCISGGYQDPLLGFYQVFTLICSGMFKLLTGTRKRTRNKSYKNLLHPTNPYKSLYAHIEIVVAFSVFISLSVLVVASLGGGVTTLNFDRMFLLCILYLPLPIRTRFINNCPWFFLALKFSRTICSCLLDF